MQAEGRGFEPRLVHPVLPAGRLLDSCRPVFRTANLPVTPPRLPCRSSCRRASRACRLLAVKPLRRTRCGAHRPLRDDTRRKTDSRISLISRYFRITSDTVVSHHDESSFPPHALPCDTGSGEMPSPFACLPVPFPTMLGIARRIQYRDNSMADPICAFSVDGGFPGCHVPSLCYSINIPSERCSRPSLPG